MCRQSVDYEAVCTKTMWFSVLVKKMPPQREHGERARAINPKEVRAL